MAGRIIGALCCLLCAFPFYMIAWIGKDSRKPIPLWTGDEDRLMGIVRDVPAYNAEMTKLYRTFSYAWLIDAVCFALVPELGVLWMILLCTVGIWLLIRRYRILLKKYS